MLHLQGTLTSLLENLIHYCDLALFVPDVQYVIDASNLHPSVDCKESQSLRTSLSDVIPPF